jgi:Flp pilus assembly protein TadG
MKAFRKFIRNEDGNYAALMALMALPIIGSVAVAVDYSNTTRLKAELRNAADAACVPIAKMYLSGDYSDSQVMEKGFEYFKANFNMNTQFVSDIALNIILPNAAGNTSKMLTCQGTLTYKTIFGPALAMLTRQDTARYVAVIEESVMKMKNVAEIALVVDASGSMSDATLSGKTRMELLKSSAKNLVHDLIVEGQKITGSSNAVKFSVVPFSASVNVGKQYRTATWMDNQGISPIHHENLNWGTMGAATTPWKSNGANNAKLDSTGNPINRFHILDNLKFANGGTESATCRVWKAGTTTGSTANDSNCAVKERSGTLTYLYPSKAADRTTLATAMGVSTATLEQKYVWGGCVEVRPYPLNLQDDAPTTSNPGTFFVPMVALDEYNNDRYGVTSNSSVNNSTAGDSGSVNSWWPDTVPAATKTITNSGFYYYTSAGSLSATWKTTNGRGRFVDATKYYNETPFLLGSSTSASSTSSSNLRKGQWHYFKSDAGVNASCTTTPITPLTGTESTITAALDALQPTGNTNVTEGLAWGWRTVSKGEPFTEGVADTNRSVDKVIIVFTDGANTYASMNPNSDYAAHLSTYAAYGYSGWANNLGVPNNTVPGAQVTSSNRARIFQGNSLSQTASNFGASMIDQMGELCNNVKDTDRILLMTVALDLDKNVTSENNMIEALKACAGDSRTRKTSGGDPAKMFWNACSRTVSDGSCTTLEDTFIQIKDELSNLRFVG